MPVKSLTRKSSVSSLNSYTTQCTQNSYSTSLPFNDHKRNNKELLTVLPFWKWGILMEELKNLDDWFWIIYIFLPFLHLHVTFSSSLKLNIDLSIIFNKMKITSLTPNGIDELVQGNSAIVQIVDRAFVDREEMKFIK